MRDQRREPRAIGRDQRRGHNGGKRGFVSGRRRTRLTGCLLSLDGGGSHPRHIRGDRFDHQRRRRTQPFFGLQRRDHPLVADGGHTELGGQPVPRGRCGNHRCRARAAIHAPGVHLRWQRPKIHRYELLTSSRVFGGLSDVRPVSHHGESSSISASHMGGATPARSRCPPE